jgi:hypothetical protein
MGWQIAAEVVVAAETGAVKDRTCHERIVTCALLSVLGRSSVATREPTIVDRGRKSRRTSRVPKEHQATQRTKPSSLPQIRFCPVDRNRRIPNGPSGGVGGRRE